MAKGMHWLKQATVTKPDGEPAPALPKTEAPPVKKMLLTAGGPVTAERVGAAFSPPAPLEPEERDAAIALALDAAGANTLPSGPKTWLYTRVGRYGLDEPTLNLGGLRPASLGCGRSGAPKFATFASIGEAAETLVDVARRAGATADHPAPDLLPIGGLDERGEWRAFWELGPYVDERGRARRGWHHSATMDVSGSGWPVYPSTEIPPAPLDVGWICLLGPDDKAQKLYEDLRADWAGFKTAGVGTGKLAFLAPDVEAWNKFSAAWEASDRVPCILLAYHDSDLGEPAELGARLNAQVMNANRVRAEIATLATGTPMAPGDLPGTRKGLDDAPGVSWMGKRSEVVDTWAREHPVVDWFTNPKQAPDDAAKRIGLGGLALLAALLGGLFYLAKPRAPRIYLSTKRNR